MDNSIVALILVSIFSSAVAVPLQRGETCSRHCTESSRFHFTPGTTYTYDYETSTTTSIKGTSHDQSQLQMRAHVDIEVLSKCELSLRLRGVSLKQSDPQSPEYLNPIRGGRDFARSVEKHILKFSYQDGVIEHICPTENAPTFVTNIHRGILSSFQNSMPNFDRSEIVAETDVSGKCAVEYQSLGRSWRGTLSVRKLKNLDACTDRHNIDTSLQATPFTRDSSIQSAPLVSGNQECEQSIGSGLLQSSTCTEKLSFRPFSRNGAGATTVVQQKLTFSTTSKNSFTGNDYRPTKLGLLYDHGQTEESSGRSAAQQAEEAMSELCQASELDMAISVPGKFAAFVHRLRKLDYESLVNLYGRVDAVCPRNKKAKKFFLDAIPVISTTSSVQFMVEMISRKEVTDSESNFWFSSLSFVSEPTPEMISVLEPLLDGRFEQAYLGVSSLVHTFCKTNDCSKIAEVRSVTYRLIESLGESCFHPDTRKILLVLKSVGNIGFAFGRESILERCFMNPQLKIEVRLAAIQAFRRFSCDISRDTFLKNFRNYNEDSEIRIASYLAAMRCMDSSMLQIIKETLEHEQVNQVGSFVWTHIQALAKSRHPDRQDMKDIVSSLYLLNKYHSDIRKFSSAHEASVYLDSIDSGLHMDSHLIFPTHSYLPHSASFNLTVDIFGHSCNLLQLDGRLEGMERVMERFFGPSGYFPQKQVSKLLREKRSINENKISKMDREFDAKNTMEEKPYGSLDVKVFGNTMFFSQFEEGEQGQASINLLELLTQLSQKKEKEFSRSFMFLDTNYAVPMGTGLPLRLSLNGTTTVGLKIGGKFDVRSFNNVDVHSHIEPSGSVELAGLLTIDVGNAARTGLRIAATLHSSTLLDAKVEVRNGEVVKAELNMPREKIEIIDVRSKLYLLYGSDEREQVGQKSERFHFNSCVGQFSRKVLGIELCSDISLPRGERNSPMHPMNGAAVFSLYLQKTDPTLTKYIFDASFENKMVNGLSVRHGVFSVNTPNSKIDREVSLQFHLNQPDSTFTLEAKTPVKKFGLNAKYVNTNSLKKLDVSTTVDDKNTFSMRSELTMTSKDDGMSYFPTLEIRLPSRNLVSVTSSAHIRPGVKYGASLSIKDITEQPIVFQGNFERKKRDRYEGELSLKSFALDTNVKGSVQTGSNTFVKLAADYRIMESKTYKINVNGKIRDLSASSLMKCTGVLNMHASAFPEWDTSVSWDTMQTKGHVENTLSFAIGDGARSRVHSINVQQIVRYKGDLSNNQAEVVLKFSYPEMNINYALDIKHQNTMNTLKNVMDIQYATNRMVSTYLDLNRAEGNALSYSGEAKLQYPGRQARVSLELTEEKPSEYRVAATLQSQRGKQVVIVGHYKNKDDSYALKQEVDAEITLPNRSPITVMATVAAHDSQYSGLAEVNLSLEKYRISGEYKTGKGFNHRASGQLLLASELYSVDAGVQQSQGKLVGDFEVKFPNHRTVSGKLDIKNTDSYKTATAGVMWDADRDKTKRFGIDSEIRAKPNGYDGRVTVQVLRRTVRTSLSTTRDGNLFGKYFKSSYKGEIEWSSRRRATFEMNANVMNERGRRELATGVAVTTPYLGYESMELNINHVFENQQWSSEVSAMLSPDKKCVLSTEGKYFFGGRSSSVEGNFKVQTPFQNFESFLLNVTNVHDAMRFSNKIHMELRPNKHVKTELYYSLIESGFKSGLKLATPFAPLNDISAEVTHSYISGNYKTKGELQYAPRRKIDGVVDIRVGQSGRRTMCSVVTSINTPFREFEVLSSKLVYNNDGTTLNTDVEVHSNGRKVAFGTTLTRKNSYYNKNMESKMYFSSPFNGYDNLQLASSFQSTPDSYKVNADGRLPHKTSVSFNSEGKYASINNIELNAVLSGKLPNYGNFQRVSLDVVHKLQNSVLRSTVDMSYGNKQVTVLLTGESKPGYRSRDVEGSLSVKTPFRGYEDLKLDMTHNQNDREYSSRIEANKNRENILVVHNVNFKDVMNFESNFHLTSSMPSIKNVKASLRQFYNPGYFTHNTNVELDSNQAMSLDAQYQGKMSSKELTVKLNTPYEPMKTFELTATHQSGNMDYKSKLSLVRNKKTMLLIDGSLVNHEMQQVDGTVVVAYNIGSPLRYQLTTKYDLTEAKKTIDIQFTYNQQTISLTGSALPSYRMPQMEIVLSTPFRNYEKATFIARAENKSNRKHASLSYERAKQKIVITGRYNSNEDSTSFEASFTSPYTYAKLLKASAKYQRQNQGMSAETSLQYSENDKLTFIVESSSGNGKYDLKAIATTPFRNYESTKVEVSSDTSSKKNVASVLLLYGRKQMIKLTSECEVKKTSRERTGEFLIKLEGSPVATMSASSSYKVKSLRDFETGFNLDLGNEQAYGLEASLKKNNDLAIRITTPHRSYRTLELTARANHANGHSQLGATLALEEREIKLTASCEQRENEIDAMIQITTPFRSFPELSMQGTLKNNRYKLVDGSFGLKTPFESLRSLNALAIYKQDSHKENFELKFNTPTRSATMTGRVSNSLRRPLEASLSLDASFTSFRKFNVEGRFDHTHGLLNSKGKGSVTIGEKNHEIALDLVQKGDSLSGEISARSPLLETGSSQIVFKVKDSDKLESEVKVVHSGKRHIVTATYIEQGSEKEFNVELNSPLLPEQTVGIQGKYAERRQRRNIDAKLMLILPRANHQATLKYDTNDRQGFADLTVESDLLPSSRININAKYVNGNGRDLEMSVSATTPDSTHSAVANVKNYDGEKFFQLKVDCPLLPSRRISVTGTLKHVNFDAVDGILTLTAARKEIRIAANMKRTRMEIVEAFVTLNTPFESLSMVRVDGGLKIHPSNFECNLQMETSNKKLPTLGFTAKLNRAEGSEDLSLVLHLPSRDYRTVQLLGNLHYNSDKTVADSRLTFSVPPKRYSVYGHYVLSEASLSVDGELELESKKYTAFGQLQNQNENKEISGSITTPHRGTYTASCGVRCSGDRHSMAVSFSNPKNQAYNVNMTMEIPSISNFIVVVEATTPHENFRRVDVKVKHMNRDIRHVVSDIEYSINNRKAFLNVYHNVDREDSRCSIRIGSPYRQLQEAEASLVRFNRGRDQKFELNYNRRRQLKAEMSTVRGSLNLLLDLPPVPLTVTAKSKTLDGGREIEVKSNCPTRTMTFKTIYQNSPRQFVHESTLVWDETEKKSISYSTKLYDISKDKNYGKELVAQVNFPLRSLAFKSSYTQSGRMSSAGMDFSWDAARNPEKHFTVGMEHQDLTHRGQLSHKVKFTVAHPELENEIVQTSLLTLSSNMLHVKGDLQYSRLQEHNLMAELRATDMSQGRRETHYKAEMNLRHPVSHLDVRAVGEVTDNGDEYITHLKISNINRKRGQTLREIRAKILKVRKQIDILMRSGNDQMTVSGKVLNKDNELTLLLEQQINDKPNLNAFLRFNRNQKSLDVNVTKGEKKGVRLMASFPEESATLKISHFKDQEEETDVNVFVGLEKARILRSRIHWKPGMLRNLRIETGDIIRDYSHYASKSMKTFVNEMSHESEIYAESIKGAIMQQMSPFFRSVEQDLTRLSSDVTHGINYVKTLYRNNEFLMRDIVEALRTARRGIVECYNVMSLITETMMNIAHEYYEELYDSMYFAFEDFCKYSKEMYQRMNLRLKAMSRNGMKNLRASFKTFHSIVTSYSTRVSARIQMLADRVIETMENGIKSYAPCLIDMYYYFHQASDRIRERLSNTMTSTAKYITEHPLYIAVNDYFGRAVATVQAFQMADISTTIQSRILLFGEQAQDFMNRLSDVELLDIIRSRLPDPQHVAGVAKATFDKGVEIYTALGLDQVFKTLFQYSLEQMKKAILSSGHDLLQEFYQLKDYAKYDFDARKGILSFEYRLPSSRATVYDVVNFVKYPDYKKVNEFKESFITKYYSDFCVWDVYYKVKNFFNVRQWMPPFTSHAMVAGNQHFVTFDKFAFDFAGECSYLLARDFVDKNFTVVANYKREGSRVVRKSLTVDSEGSKIEVSSDNKVVLNDMRVEMPIRVGHTVVSRQGSTTRIENVRKGFTVICNFVHDICTVGMSGFYFAKTGGLFGTYDNEPRLDMMTPERTPASDIETFANSWEVGKASCRRDNMATIPGNDLRVQEKCKALFSKTSSQFRSCFKQVDPEIYMKMCVSDLSAVNERDFDSAICTAAAAYFTECNIEGVLIKMPKQCVRCESHQGRQVTEGSSSKFTQDNPSHTADVVFVVEEKECNRENFKYLNKLAHNIEESFNQKGFRDIRYRVVGFGGSDIHEMPHVHTMEGQDYGTIRTVDLAFQTLQAGNGPVNMLEALRYAAGLDYRPGTSKSFILLKCSTCKAEEKKAEYGEMLRTLLDGDIALHVLMEQKYEMKITSSKNSKAKKVIGVDKNFAYTLKDLKDPNSLGDEELLGQLKVPKDICIPLALEVNGSTFDSQYLSEVKRNTYKKFMDVLARRIVRSASEKPGLALCCECIATDDGVGKTTCQRCVSAEVANMISDDSSFISHQTQRRGTIDKRRN